MSTSTDEPTLTPSTGEILACPVCGSEGGGPVVGRHARFQQNAKNICCNACSAVFQCPRPAPEAMAEYLRAEHKRSANVGYITEHGTISIEDASYEETKRAYYAQRADNCILLTRAQAGDRILEVGLGNSETLDVQRRLHGIVAQAVTLDCLGSDEASCVAQHDIPCFTGGLENFDPGDTRFDVVQMFHVLQRACDPLGTLLRARELLSPGGRLVIEVPNVYEPYGLLEENFFQRVNLVSFSPSTLPALLRRAGFTIERVVEAGTLFVVGQLDPSTTALPRAFERSLLQAPEHDASWVAIRLSTYAALEKIRHRVLSEGPSMDLVHALVRQLMQPAFESHLTQVVTDLVEFFMGHRAIGLACVVATAASEGPYHKEIQQGFAALATEIRRFPLSEQERSNTALLDAPRADDIRLHKQRFKRAVKAARSRQSEPSMFFIPVNLGSSLPKKWTGPQA